MLLRRSSWLRFALYSSPSIGAHITSAHKMATERETFRHSRRSESPANRPNRHTNIGPAHSTNASTSGPKPTALGRFVARFVLHSAMCTKPKIGGPSSWAHPIAARHTKTLCPSVCVSVCVSVCLSVHKTARKTRPINRAHARVGPASARWRPASNTWEAHLLLAWLGCGCSQQQVGSASLAQTANTTLGSWCSICWPRSRVSPFELRKRCKPQAEPTRTGQRSRIWGPNLAANGIHLGRNHRFDWWPVGRAQVKLLAQVYGRPMII